MFRSLKSWINIPFSIKPFVKHSGTGDKTFGELINAKCYPVADIRIIRNFNGIDVTSNTQLYIPGSITIKSDDVIVYEGTEYAIQAISTFYRNGVADLKVVYI